MELNDTIETNEDSEEFTYKEDTDTECQLQLTPDELK